MNKKKSPTYGIEEEVFITEPQTPNLRSLFYLARLLWKNPIRNYTHTSSNLADLSDFKTGLMAGVEISTDVHQNIKDLIQDLKSRRIDLANVCDGLIVPIGHLINFHSYSKTSGLHIHIGNLENMDLAYQNIAYFLPLLSLLTINSPYFENKYFGQSIRIYRSPFIGPLRKNRYYRFQDLIISRRLKTIEIRIFDPVWDIDRIRILLEALEKIINLNEKLHFEQKKYNHFRVIAACRGFQKNMEPICQRLNEIYPLPKKLFCQTPSNITADYYRKYGLIKTYSALDNAYRYGNLKPSKKISCQTNLLPIFLGFVGYYIPKLPYNLWKVIRENVF